MNSNSKQLAATIISTHLKLGDSKAEKKRRYHELKSIFDNEKKEIFSSSEKDYIILGDMQIPRTPSLTLQHFLVPNNHF